MWVILVQEGGVIESVIRTQEFGMRYQETNRNKQSRKNDKARKLKHPPPRKNNNQCFFSISHSHMAVRAKLEKTRTDQEEGEKE